MGYDPIVEAVGGPTYVDDLAGLQKGPGRALRMQYFLLAAGHAAGLSVSTHRCERIVGTSVAPAALAALRRFPITTTWRGQEMVIEGLPPHVMDAIGREVAGPTWITGPR
eukprot:3919470-Lingulodinium_polyedra.AAC.1